MRNRTLTAMPAAELVALFAELGVQQDRAILTGDTRAFNNLYDEVAQIGRELGARPVTHAAI